MKKSFSGPDSRCRSLCTFLHNHIFPLIVDVGPFVRFYTITYFQRIQIGVLKNFHGKMKSFSSNVFMWFFSYVGDEPSVGGPCPSANYCPGGTGTPIPCDPGTWNNITCE